MLERRAARKWVSEGGDHCVPMKLSQVLQQGHRVTLTGQVFLLAAVCLCLVLG